MEPDESGNYNFFWKHSEEVAISYNGVTGYVTESSTERIVTMATESVPTVRDPGGPSPVGTFDYGVIVGEVATNNLSYDSTSFLQEGVDDYGGRTEAGKKRNETALRSQVDVLDSENARLRRRRGGGFHYDGVRATDNSSYGFLNRGQFSSFFKQIKVEAKVHVICGWVKVADSILPSWMLSEVQGMDTPYLP
uniref:Uncharacterized protein n=1 Tax=Tanacetum cinerariifolium TaxID=118510 RepID=A0A6L2K5J0_TANCI|nr:hypothetical protein [Tanacetum cinerariifolium]